MIPVVLLLSTLATTIATDIEPQRMLQASSKAIKLNEFYSETLEGFGGDDKWAYFTLDLQSQVNQTLTYDDALTDLIIQVQQTGSKFTDPNLYISFSEHQPTLVQHQVKCGFYGEDFCIINGKELENKTMLTLGVFCNDECEFKLQAELTQELLFEPGKSYKLYFLANQERVIRFSIPDKPEIKQVEIKGINENKFDKFNMIMSKGNTLPNSDNALYLRPAWENGYVGKFSDDCSCFCKGCNYTVLVSTQKEGYITVGAKVTGQVVDLTSQNGEIYDSVLYHHQQCYSYQVTQAKKDLKIKLESFSGDPNIYVNPLVQSNNLFTSAFNSRDHFDDEELILTPVERAEHNATTGLYYICIFGNTAATFKITIKNEDHDVFLKTGLSASGYIEFNTTQIYYFRDPILAKKDAEIDFQLHVMTGTARLRAKLCEINFDDQYSNFKDNCTWTLEELLEEDPNEALQSHVGNEAEKTNTTICKMPSNSTRGAQVSCVYAIGMLGIATFKSHYSVLVKTNETTDYVILKEGVPALGEIREVQSKFFLASIHDPNTTKISFQMTTIHGDPDIFISRTEKLPDQYKFERRSIKCGIYPEIVEFKVNPNDEKLKTLEGEYYIGVFGYVQSTFSIVYFVETEGGNQSKVKLLTGQKQKGVLKETTDSMLYYFRLSNEVKEDVEVKLHSENGHYKVYLGQSFVPSSSNYTLVGDDHSPIIFKQNYTSNDQISYYIRVVPQQLSSSELTKDSAGMAYVYTIAFYEQGSFIHLEEGISNRGSLTNETFHYYYFEVYNSSSSYEISLTAISGNPDLVLSLDPSNKFPSREINDYISNSTFSTDSITLNSETMTDYESKHKIKVKTVYIGVYTNDASLTYSILVTKKQNFAPILLTNGQIQQGVLEVNETKYYYFKTGSSQPVYATLSPKQGNPDLYLYFIKNLSSSVTEWQKIVYRDADYYSQESFGADIIYLNPTQPKFAQGCGASCIILLKIENNDIESHYTVSITRDIQELAENNQVQDQIGDFGEYKYYQFYKSCDTCDLDITITPQQIYHNLVLLVDHNATNKLPSHQIYPAWTLNANQQSSLIISSDDELFKDKSSKGQYIIGVHAHQNASYQLSVQTLAHGSASALNLNNSLNIRKVYIGESQDINFQPDQVKYFFFENWVNASIMFQYVSTEPTASKMRQPLMDMRITTVSTKNVPKILDEIEGNDWLTNSVKYTYIFQQSFKDTLKVNQDTQEIDFCVQCYYIIRLQNVRLDKDVDIRLQISQNDQDSSGFMSSLMLGRPYSLKIGAYEKVQLSFQIGELTGDSLAANFQYYTGKAKISFVDENLKSELFPKQELSKDKLVMKENPSQLQFILSQLSSTKKYKLIIEALTDLHASLLVTSNEDIQVIADGIPMKLYLDSELSIVSRYLTYVPPSHKFQFAVNAFTYNFGMPFKISIKKMSSSSEGRVLGANAEFNQLGVKYQSLKDFDYEIDSINSKDKLNVFEVVPIELNDADDLLLIKVEVIKGNKRTADLQVTFSGSEVQFLALGQTVRGHVSNWNTTFRIYELYINKANLFVNDTTDLYIEVTPCNGRVHFYVSEDYMALFKNTTHAGLLDLVIYQMFGKSTSRVKDVSKLDVVYIGVESSNEFYSFFDQQIDSFFEVKAQLIPGSQKDLMETYFFDKSNKEIELVSDMKDHNSYSLKWNNIYQINKGADRIYQPAEDVTYQMFLGSNQSARFSMNSICAIEHSDPHLITSLYIDPKDMQKREIKLKKADLQNIKVIGLIARVKDPISGEIVNLAYEPYTFVTESFGVKIQMYQLILIVVLGMIILFFLGFIIYCLRRKSRKLEQRIQAEGRYEVQTNSLSTSQRYLS